MSKGKGINLILKIDKKICGGLKKKTAKTNEMCFGCTI
jgi:hypothetical protein